jgi:hypothetical protein
MQGWEDRKRQKGVGKGRRRRNGSRQQHSSSTPHEVHPSDTLYHSHASSNPYTYTCGGSTFSNVAGTRGFLQTLRQLRRSSSVPGTSTSLLAATSRGSLSTDDLGTQRRPRVERGLSRLLDTTGTLSFTARQVSAADLQVPIPHTHRRPLHVGSPHQPPHINNRSINTCRALGR